MNVVDSKPVSLDEAKDLLEKREKDGEELGYEQQQALEYLKKFAKGKEKEAVKELMKNKKLPLEAALKLADVAPKRPETVKAVLIQYKLELSDEEIAEVLRIVK